MTTLDIVLAILFLPAIVTGIRKGLIGQIASVAALTVGLLMAYKFYPAAAGLIARFTKDANPVILNIAGFASVLILTGLAITIIGKILAGLFKMASLGWLNRLLGVLLAIAVTVFCLSVAVYLFDGLNNRVQILSADITDKSVLYGFFKQFASNVLPFLKELVSSQVKLSV